MTYHNMSEPLVHAISNSATPVAGYLRSIGKFFSAIGAGLVRVGEASSRARELEVLNAKTDAQLAEMGLKREDIVRFVFRDMMYI